VDKIQRKHLKPQVIGLRSKQKNEKEAAAKKTV